MLPLRDRLPTRTVPFVNYLIIVGCVLTYLWQGAVREAGYADVASTLGFVPYKFHIEPIGYAPTIVTSMFLHGSFMHLAGNMLFLWIFGDNVEDAIGHLRYLAFYLIGGVLAAMAQLVVDPESVIPMVGASGAIAGVLGAYVALYPRSPVTILNPVPWLWFTFGIFVELPAWLVVLEWFALNLLQGLGSLGGPHATGGVAFFAHIGGFIAGLVLVHVFLLGRQRIQADRWSGWQPPNRRPRSGYGDYGSYR